MSIAVHTGRSATLPARQETAATGAAAWQPAYRRLVFEVDLMMLLTAGAAALLLRFGFAAAGDVSEFLYRVVPFAGIVVWLVVLRLGGAYDVRFLGSGTEEYRLVTNASLRFAAVVVVAAYATKSEVARGFVAIALPLGMLLLVAGRTAAQAWLAARRRRGECLFRTLLVARGSDPDDVVRSIRRSGVFDIEAACYPHGGVPDSADALPVVDIRSGIVDAARELGADTLVVTSGALSPDELQLVTTELVGTGLQLIVAPALTGVAGPRVHVRPVAGLPLLHVEEPELTGGRRVLKGAFDRAAALTALVILAPLLLVLAVAVRLTDGGPALFRQERVGRGGTTFQVLKFRSMCMDAEQRLAQLTAHNEHDGVLFKMRADPRVTRVGKWLRRFSLDELPQLVNVLRGEMSLVGPRPPLASEVARYESEVHRRLLVKPGITGLWQVSGRSDLSWEDSVRLDLSYVENWSLIGDIAILLRTVSAVVAVRGAY